MTLQELLDDHGIEHFGAHELHSRRVRGGPKVDAAPVELWPNILPTLVLADEIRCRLGEPLTVWSGYRTPHYNDVVLGRKPTSEHKQFKALDLHHPTKHNLLVGIARGVMLMADDEGLRTGFGIYDNFIHIDAGSTKGRKRRWDERA